MHNPIQVVDDVVHKLDQLGFARPLTSETMLTVSKYEGLDGGSNIHYSLNFSPLFIKIRPIIH